jgi:hypothetical protein
VKIDSIKKLLEKPIGTIDTLYWFKLENPVKGGIALRDMSGSERRLGYSSKQSRKGKSGSGSDTASGKAIGRAIKGATISALTGGSRKKTRGGGRKTRKLRKSK